MLPNEGPVYSSNFGCLREVFACVWIGPVKEHTTSGEFGWCVGARDSDGTYVVPGCIVIPSKHKLLCPDV